VVTIGSKVISFRVPKELYDEFEQKFNSEEVSLIVKLRKFANNIFKAVMVVQILKLCTRYP